MRFRSKPSTVPHPVRRILVATDRSETAERAVAWAADMAERYEAELLLFQVVAQTGEQAAAETGLSEHANALAGERGHSLVATADDPAAAIIEAARAQRADVLVLGSVGMSGRREFLLRNVPNWVSHNAPCTVVVVDTRERR